MAGRRSPSRSRPKPPDLTGEADTPSREDFLRAFTERGPEEFICQGHPIGDLLEAHRWKVVAGRPGEPSIHAHLPAPLRNLKGQLFGRLTPTFLDLVGVLTVHAGEPKKEIGFPFWLSTVNLRMDYFEPIASDEFRIQSRVIRRRPRICLVETSFLDPEDTVAAIGWVTVNVAERTSRA